METNIYLQDILPLDKLKAEGKVLLVRHYHDRLDEMIKKELIEEYQSFQSKPAFLDCKYIVRILEHSDTHSGFIRTLFQYELFSKIGI